MNGNLRLGPPPLSNSIRAAISVYHIRRPLFIVWAVIVVFTACAMSSGVMKIRTGDSTVGGTKAFVTSEFAVGQQLAVVTLLFYGFFIAGGRRHDGDPGRSLAAWRTDTRHIIAFRRIYLGQVHGYSCRLWRSSSSLHLSVNARFSIMCCPIPKPRRFVGHCLSRSIICDAGAFCSQSRRSSFWPECRSRSAS